MYSTIVVYLLLFLRKIQKVWINLIRGPILVAALAEICIRRPADPIEYLGHWLLRWRYNEELKRRDVQNAMEVVQQRQWAQMKEQTEAMLTENVPDKVATDVPDDIYAKGQTGEENDDENQLLQGRTSSTRKKSEASKLSVDKQRESNLDRKKSGADDRRVSQGDKKMSQGKKSIQGDGGTDEEARKASGGSKKSKDLTDAAKKSEIAPPAPTESAAAAAEPPPA
ncbi:unnamed protein product [Allacma fusca]|uniref:Uncharacterized protein n=1 Tax=Allacma fusca TaxID=39272 RepID=A0A8J2KFS0_9HEXA|nr:unnamed protein product [Allacma fusca]